MLLFELFDVKPVDITWRPTDVDDGHKEYNQIYVDDEALFRIGKEKISVKFQKTLPHDKNIEVENPKEYFYRTEVSFTSSKNYGSFGKTDSNKALAVFNGVAVAIKEYLNKKDNKDVETLFFSTTAGKGRANIYTGIIKRRLKQYLPSATIETVEHIGDQIFKIHLNK